MAAPEMGEDKSNLASQCMAFCQALASKGQIFSFTLNVGSSFAFSLDTRENGSSTLSKKRKSPSTRRRNARRRAEFLAKKRGPPESESSAGKTTPEKVARPEKGRDFKCDQCDKDFKSENGLKIHVGKTHNNVDSDLATPEVARNQLRSSVSLSASPLLNTSREESSVHHEAVVGDQARPKFVLKHTCPSYLCSKVRCPKETEEQKRHWQEMLELGTLREFLDKQSEDFS